MERHQPHETEPKSQGDLERLAVERLKNLEHEHTEHQQDRSEHVEKAREQLKAAEEARPPAETAPAEPADRPVLTKEVNYRQTMVSLRHRMKPAARQFSKIIHIPAVEAASEIVGKTVLRPSVTLGATTTAVLLAGVVYFSARYYGFVMKGSEIWIALILGGIIGVTLEGLYKFFRRLSRKS
ncbi:MAG TPA: hypothetical protein VMR98_05985 [Candidatus Polarisedimenticolaceae bacterium]|nr:hypothetical protein [Candidatus Polarisedimenticolaceae bacterium]